MSDAMAVLHKLQTGLDVNVKFTGVRVFEYTPECIVFDLLDIPLYHGWLVDPQVRWTLLIAAVSPSPPWNPLVFLSYCLSWTQLCLFQVHYELWNILPANSCCWSEVVLTHIVGSLMPSSFCLLCINPNLLKNNPCTDFLCRPASSALHEPTGKKPNSLFWWLSFTELYYSLFIFSSVTNSSEINRWLWAFLVVIET